jgi:hypothetical protein
MTSGRCNRGKTVGRKPEDRISESSRFPGCSMIFEKYLTENYIIQIPINLNVSEFKPKKDVFKNSLFQKSGNECTINFDDQYLKFLLACSEQVLLACSHLNKKRNRF